MQDEAQVVEIRTLCELAVNAGFSEARWDEFGYLINEGRVMLGPLTGPQQDLLSLSQILYDLEQDSRFESYFLEDDQERIGSIMVWCDETEVDDPGGITFVYLTPDDLVQIVALDLH